MIDKTVLDYLTERLQVPVYMEMPEKNTPGMFVLVEKTGGSRRDQISSAMMAIQSYGESLYTAANLNEQVKLVMQYLPEKDDVASCRLNNDYNFTDTSTKRYRYQAVYDIVHE